jgi:hypothetical protein
MGLVWLALSAILLLLAAASLLNFPYIPLFFGLYGANAVSLRGRLMRKALTAFPILAVGAVILGWIITPLAFGVPFIWLILLWLIKPDTGSERISRFKDASENRQALADELVFELNNAPFWGQHGSYLLCIVLCPTDQAANTFCASLRHIRTHSPNVLKQSGDDTLCELRLDLQALTQPQLVSLLDEITQCAWKQSAVVSSINILRE